MEILMCQLKSLISTPLVRGDQRGGNSPDEPWACDGQTNRDKQRHKASIPFHNVKNPATP
ncbi:MAG TPA: hypothetical protein DHW77_05360 [Verrucomicrobiales bacterium]|nr:hypothetical protein [Verrucomicrobiales bacterium]